MNIERRNFLLLLAWLLVTLCLTLILTMRLERTPEMQQSANHSPVLPGQKSDAQEVINAAASLLNAREFAAAETMLTSAVQQHPGESDLWLLLGAAYYQQEKISQAEQSFRHLIKLQSDNAAAYNNLAETLVRQERLSEAQTAIMHAIKLEPTNGEILLHAASLYALQEKDQLALYHLKQAMDRGVRPETVSRYKELVRLLERPDFMNYYRQQKNERSKRQKL